MQIHNLRGSLGVGVFYFEIAEVYAHLNLIDEAFESLELASENAEDMSSIRISAFFRKLHGDSRWSDILLQVGLADEQVSDLEL